MHILREEGLTNLLNYSMDNIDYGGSRAIAKYAK